jgi:hypothetical protein
MKDIHADNNNDSYDYDYDYDNNSTAKLSWGSNDFKASYID